jgi:hypothetical protein
VPDDGSCELRHVAQYYVTLKWRVGRCTCTSVVGDIEKHNGIYQNKNDPSAVKVGVLGSKISRSISITTASPRRLE